MSKRLAALESMIQKGSKDPFAWYALALEYAGADRIDDALRTFTTLRDMDAGYVPQYLMCGQMLVKAGRVDAGREWLEEGVTRARAKGDSHALSEIQSALSALDDD
ncbi:tetratricopeptide repeat protein [Polyangium spumosum]|uniref:Tetratricopeptide repeat protein n=1 Tax=Polyangium spumosum TaxID=889282 RepID=A0A6N7PR00_9BACT|nr:tetratricopeptide repeat protein [Polyangium spumosum]